MLFNHKNDVNNIYLCRLIKIMKKETTLNEFFFILCFCSDLDEIYIVFSSIFIKK
jgi:hypothetical protein